VLLTVLDIIGTFAFAIFGANKALEKKFDLFGIFICAMATALGGGTVREMMLGNQPVFLHNYVYVYTVVLGVAFAITIRRVFLKVKTIMLVIDAVGLSTFAIIGAQRADVYGLGIGAMISFAVLTAAGGGVISDILTQRKPLIFYRDFYATPAIIGGIGYYLLRPYMLTPPTVYALIGIVLVLRLTKIYLQLAHHGSYRRLVRYRLRLLEDSQL
jgi:uncharacterized membrane protein YeiH